MKQLFIDTKNRLKALTDGNYSYKQINAAPGLNDGTYSGAYANPSGVNNDVFTVTIAATGTPDTFNVTNSDGTLNGTGIAIIAGAIYLGYGISITFGATTGHTAGDKWTFNVTSSPLINTLAMWNNQLKLQADRSKTGAKIYGFTFPAVFLEFVAPNEIQQLGGGAQLYEPLIIKVHIAHMFTNATDVDSFGEQDLLIFDLRDKVYQCLQDYQPDGAVSFVRVAEEPQYDHKNVYHYVQHYKTNYTQPVTGIRPVYGKDKAPPTTGAISVSFNNPPGLK